MKKAIKVLGLLMISGLMMVSCKKYDNGGTLKKAEKNLAKTWKIDTYYMDGVDNTSSLLISNYSETFTDAGVYSRSYNDSNGDLQSESGSWSLDNNKSLINVSGTGSYELTAQTSTVSTSDYTILKLKKDELWYEFTNGGSTHEFHLIPN